MSSGDEPRELTSEEIVSLKNLMVDECMRGRYMTKEETVTHLASEKNIDPGLTQFVWERYEMKRPDWFQEYYRKMKERRQNIPRNVNDHEADQSTHQAAESSNTAMAAVEESTTTLAASTILKTTTSDSSDTSEWFMVDSPFETNDENVPQGRIFSEEFHIIEDYISQLKLASTNTKNLHAEGNDEQQQDRLGKDGISSQCFPKKTGSYYSKLTGLIADLN